MRYLSDILDGLLAQVGSVLHPVDGGPVYVETNLDAFIKEPWNTASLLPFLVIVIYWLIRLRGQYRRHAFLLGCLPILLVGGVGGTIYHATRSHRVWLFMDWVPIAVLCFATGLYLWKKALGRWWLLVLAMVPLIFLAQRYNFRNLPRGWAINISYSILASFILIPALVTMWKTVFRGAGWALAAAGAFGLAILSRAADAQLAVVLPMGTHWLWHVFGAVATQCIATYLYTLNAEPASQVRPAETVGQQSALPDAAT